MEFYKNVADPNLTPVYVYSSPNETGYPHDQFDTDMKPPASTRRSSNRAKDILYGFATMGEATYNTMQQTLALIDERQ